MGNPKGFLNIERKESGYRPIEERVQDYNEVEITLSDEDRKLQASRCMDCGVAFCHWSCPVGNIMPEWQDKLFKDDWKAAYEILQETSNFPEFTGRVCPALCEGSCVLSINDKSVTVRQNELAVIEKAFAEGWVTPKIPKKRTGKKVAVIGAGPAGLACSDLLNKAGHEVDLIEAADEVGGYLRYGIPDFKLAKKVIDRRVDVLKAEGLNVKTGTKAGEDISIEDLENNYDAICVTIGAREARDLPIEGRELDGIHLAMDFLEQQNRIVKGEKFSDSDLINPLDKNVVVIGGGDTGSDCVGSSNRQSAKNIHQLELMPKPSEHRTEDTPWPLWPSLLKTSSSQAEGCDREWKISTKRFVGENGKLTKIEAVKVEWTKDENGRMSFNEVPGSEFEIEADLVFLAMGFTHVEQEGFVSKMGLKLTDRGNIEVDESYKTNKAKVFAAGDANTGATLVVKAMSQGRNAAKSIHEFLTK